MQKHNLRHITYEEVLLLLSLIHFPSGGHTLISLWGTTLSPLSVYVLSEALNLLQARDLGLANQTITFPWSQWLTQGQIGSLLEKRSILPVNSLEQIQDNMGPQVTSCSYMEPENGASTRGRTKKTVFGDWQCLGPS